MIVKRVLVFLPILFMLFLVQSVFWVPSASSVANDPTRINRHILYLPGNVSSMNPWKSGTATDSDVFGFIFESLFGSNGNFKMEYSLANQAQLKEEVVINLDAGMDGDKIAPELASFLKEAYPETFGSVDLPESYRGDAYDGWGAKNRYVVDVSGRSDKACDSIPDDDRFYAPYRPDFSKPDLPSDGIQRLVVHFRPNPEKTYDYAHHELPTAIAGDIKEKLKAFFEESGQQSGFVSDFDIEMSGLNWYLAKHQAELFEITAPQFAAQGEGKAAPQKGSSEKEKSGDQGNDEDKSDDATESPAKAEKGVFKADDFKPDLAEIKRFKITILAKLKAAYEASAKAPSKEQVKAWLAKVKEQVTALEARLKQIETDSKQSFSDFENNAPKARYFEHPLMHMKLREGIKWHDFGTTYPIGPLKGQKIEEYFDAGDVAFSYAFGHHEGINSPRISYCQSIRQIRIQGDHEISFLYSKVYSPAVSDLASGSIIPEHRFRTSSWIAEAKAKGRGPSESGLANYDHVADFPPEKLRFNMDPIGTGPMTLYPLNGDLLPKWKSGEMIRLERYDDYWDKTNRPLYQFLDFYIFDPSLGQETAEVVFRSGGTDNYGVRPHQVAKYEADRADYYLYKRPNLVYEFIGFNLRRELFKDLRVRQALTMSVNVPDIVKYVQYGQGERINQPGYPMLDYYDPDFIPDYTFLQGENKGKTLKEAGMTAFPFDMDEARALLDAAGWKLNSSGVREKDGKEFRFTLYTGGTESDGRGKVGLLAIENWKQLGVVAKFEGKEFNVYVKEQLYGQDFDAVVQGWSGGTGFDKRQLWHSNFSHRNQLNFVGYSDPQSDAMMEKLLTVYTDEEQVALARKLNARIANQCPYIFLYTPLSNVAVARSLYWAKPVVDANNQPVLDEHGLVKREIKAINDEELMALKYGPRTKRLQFARSKEYSFKVSDDERMQVGRPDLTWSIYRASKE